MTERIQSLPPARVIPKRREDKKGYFIPGGQVLPGVTTILGATSAGKERLEQWLKRPDSAAIGESARNRGTWLHTQVEEWIVAHNRGEPYAATPHFAFGAYWQNMRPWLERHWSQMVAIEQAVFHPAGYAGSFDALGYVDWGNEPDAFTLCDWKSSQRRRSEDLIEDYACQLGAYSLAIEFCYGVKPERALLVIARPHGSRVSPDIWEFNGEDLASAGSRFNERLRRYYTIPTETDDNDS